MMKLLLKKYGIVLQVLTMVLIIYGTYGGNVYAGRLGSFYWGFMAVFSIVLLGMSILMRIIYSTDVAARPELRKSFIEFRKESGRFKTFISRTCWLVNLIFVVMYGWWFTAGNLCITMACYFLSREIVNVQQSNPTPEPSRN
jgi:hypothetical protein